MARRFGCRKEESCPRMVSKQNKMITAAIFMPLGVSKHRLDSDGNSPGY